MIDVLLPSRGRPEMLARAVSSLRVQAACPRSVAVRVGVDSDDPATASMAASLAAHWITFARQGYERLHVYYQALAAASPADWLLVWNDDAVMLTPDWDDVLADLPSRFLVANLRSRHSPICAFPAVRREGCGGEPGCSAGDNPHVDSFWEVVGGLSGTITAVPIDVQHDQQGGHAGNEHGFHEPAHLAELAACAQRCRDAVLT